MPKTNVVMLYLNVYEFFKLRNLNDNKHIPITTMKPEAYGHIIPNHIVLQRNDILWRGYFYFFIIQFICIILIVEHFRKKCL